MTRMTPEAARLISRTEKVIRATNKRLLKMGCTLRIASRVRDREREREQRGRR